MRNIVPPLLTVLFLLAIAEPALAHEPFPAAETYHEHEAPGHDGVYDHGQDDGHHHHPHEHQPAAAPSPHGYNYNYNYGYGGGYSRPYVHQPRVIEGWRQGDPIPDGYRHETRVHGGLVKAGAATLFSVYGVSAIAGSLLVASEDKDAEDGVDSNSVDAEDYYPLFIPVVGPFITIHTVRPERAGVMGLVADGIAQSAGLAMLVIGLAIEQDVLVRIPTYGQGALEVKPLVGRGFQGLGIDGTF